MSENASQTKAATKPKGLGRGLGSLLGSSNEGAFSKNASAPNLEDLTEKVVAHTASEVPARAQAALRDGFIESSPPTQTTKAPEKSELTHSPVVAPAIPPELRIWQIGIEKIEPNANQPRQVFAKEPLEELANSIREKGIIQPLLVRKKGDKFQIIAGERRWRAAQLAGLKEVPAILKTTEDQETLELALIENIQRENLNPMEEAEAYEFLIKKYNLTQQDLAHKVGKDRATVANVLRLLNLEPSVRDMVSRGELSLGQAKVILSLEHGRQFEIAQQAKSDALSVRALEKLVAKSKAPPLEVTVEEPDIRDKMAANLSDELQKLIGSKVNLEYQAGKGRIIIHFYSDSELNQIADNLRDSWHN